MGTSENKLKTRTEKRALSEPRIMLSDNQPTNHQLPSIFGFKR